MTFLAPLGLLAAALTIPVLLLHVLTPRRDRVPVSSLLLWRRHETPVKAFAPWQRLRFSLLLLLQLLAVLLLALGLARLATVRDAPLAAHTVFVVDASGSMAAIDGSPDRLADAVARTAELYGELPDGGLASIVVAGSTPAVLVAQSDDAEEFDRALRSIRTTAATADFEAAFLLADSLVVADRTNGVVVVTDGGVPAAAQAQASPGAAVELVGDTETNRAVTGLAARRLGGALIARVTVSNTGGPAATQQLRLVVDGETIERHELALPAGEVVEREFELPEGDRVSVFLEGEDLLAADNQRYVVVPETDDLRVGVVGERNFFVDELLDAMNAIAVPGDDPETDVLIFNQVEIPADVAAPFVAIRPPSGAPGIEVVGEVEDPIPSFVRDDPLLESVDVTRLAIAETQDLEVTDGETLLAAAGAPLLVRGSANDSVPFFYFPFALERSNLPVEVAFPVLGSRMVGELIAIESLDTGFIVGERLPGTFVGTLVSPRGVEQTLTANFGSPELDQGGFWTAIDPDGGETIVAVNPDTVESTLKVPGELAAIPAADTDQASSQLDAVSVADPLIFWLALAALAVVVLESLAWWRKVGLRGPLGYRAALGLRALVVLLLIGALINPAIRRASNDMTTVFVLDTSASMTEGGVDQAQKIVVEAWRDGESGGARFGVVEVDESARLIRPVADDDFAVSPVALGPESDLSRGLRLGGSVFDGAGKQRLVLVSDGRSTSGDLAEEAERLAAFGVPVDVIVPEIGELSDAAVVNVDSPNVAEPSTVVEITAEVASNIEGPAEVELLDADGTVIETKQVDLEIGANQVSFQVEVTDPGVAHYDVRVAAEGDQTARNDRSSTAIEVSGAAEVLVVEGVAGNGKVIVEALEANGVGTEVVEGIGSLDDLRAYQSVMLIDVPAEQLPSAEIDALSAYVRELGRGLVVVGGDNAYGLGGYGETELEDLLPVDSNVKDVQREASVAEVLLIDTSESMGACHCAPIDDGNLGDGENEAGGMQFVEGEGVNKTDISRAGAARAIRVLSENDEVGLLAFNANQDWIIPLQALPSEQVVTEGLGELRPIGETRIGPALEEAAASLRNSNKELKHIILFTDGFTPELPSAMFGGADLSDEEIQREMEFIREEMGIDNDVIAQAEALAAEGITISVVATGEGAIPDLEAIAVAGNGRFYPGRDLDEIPEIFVREARLAARSVINEGEFFPTVTGSGAAVAGLSESPPLRGYVATSPKSKSQVQLTVSEFKDPLLATWRIGLGRVTAWTSDGGERWGTEWASWEANPGFWADLVRDTFPLAGSSGMRVATRFEGENLDVTLETADEIEAGSEVTAFVSGPDGETQEVRLERRDDGTFGTTVEAGAEGTYSVGVQVASAGSEAAATSGLATRSYPSEYVPGAPDREVLQAVSDATGGRGFISPSQAFDRDGLTAAAAERRFRWWMLLAAVLLWPLDIAARRVGFAGAFEWMRGHVGRLRRASPARRPTPTSPAV